MAARVLLIEDDDQVAALVRGVLTRDGHEVAVSGAGRAGLRDVNRSAPDLVVLDVGLPDLDGWQVLDRLRDISEVPVLMLTARTQSADKVRGLRGGADDYLTKPFDLAELRARVDALLRRRRMRVIPSDELAVVDGTLTIDPASGSVHVGEREVAVTPIELRLLASLVRHRGQVLSPTRLLEMAWGDPSGVSPDRVKFSVHRLRRKLGWDAEGSPIEAVRGFGYRYRRPRVD